MLLMLLERAGVSSDGQFETSTSNAINRPKTDTGSLVKVALSFNTLYTPRRLTLILQDTLLAIPKVEQAQSQERTFVFRSIMPAGRSA